VDEPDPEEGKGWDRIIGWRGFWRDLKRDHDPIERVRLVLFLFIGCGLFYVIFGSP